MQTIPQWVLALIYWLHMTGTIIWVGALASMALIVIPAARKILEPSLYLALLDEIQRRLESIATFCLALILATGMFQLGASNQYTGLFSTANAWSAAILIKHILFVLMIGVSAAMTWFVIPAIRRAKILSQRTGREDAAAIDHLRRRETMLLRANLVLALLILAATAAARAA